MNVRILAIAIGITAIILPSVIFAQEDMEYAYGTVVKVDEARKEIVVGEYDWEDDSETTVIYSLDPNVEIENIGSIAEIFPGMSVDIEYVSTEGGKRVAKLVTVYIDNLVE